VTALTGLAEAKIIEALRQQKPKLKQQQLEQQNLEDLREEAI
jgi:hypothetical protein